MRPTNEKRLSETPPTFNSESSWLIVLVGSGSLFFFFKKKKKKKIRSKIILFDKEHNIIEVLIENSRISIRDLAKKTNLRPSTVHQRIQRLRQEKVIEKFTLKLNNKAIGENFIAFILVNTKKDFDEKILANNHVKEVFGITGQYDILMKLKFKDVDEFNDFIIKFRKELSIKETLTMIVTANIKEDI
ncbi:MAG: Lrp/AsnC family transcriptional regulator [archaeon]